VFLEYLTPGRDALVVPVDDAGALSRALAAVLDDRGLAANLSAAGLATSRKFTWSRSAEEHQLVYAAAQMAQLRKPGHQFSHAAQRDST
jgi:glycosyltransferase involved in cell wall biosynthesis